MPELVNTEFPEFDWSLDNSEGPRLSTCTADALRLKFPTHTTIPIKNARFNTCDFAGKFEFARVTFRNCVFDACDFGRSVWPNAKFSDCSFNRCSFSTVNFGDVQFLNCSWAQTGMSAEEMKFDRVLVTNPAEFIGSAYTNLDETLLLQKSTNKHYQEFRLEHTKVKVARSILVSVEQLGDDEAFYEAVMTLTRQVCVAKITDAKYFRRISENYWAKLKWALLSLVLPTEWAILSFSGKINGWGGKVGRAGACGVAIIFLFSLIYLATGSACGVGEAILTGLEVTLLVGFTKYTTQMIPFVEQVIYAVNMVLGLWWYAVFVPTVINRISKVRN